MTVFAALGLLAADKLEELFPARNHKAIRPGSSPIPQQRAARGARFINHSNASETQSPTSAEERKPKLFSISVVDRS